MSGPQRTIGPEPSPDDFEIEMRDLEMRNPRLAEIMTELIEEGRVVDSGRRTFENGRWQIVWVGGRVEEDAPLVAISCRLRQFVGVREMIIIPKIRKLNRGRPKSVLRLRRQLTGDHDTIDNGQNKRAHGTRAPAETQDATEPLNPCHANSHSLTASPGY